MQEEIKLIDTHCHLNSLQNILIDEAITNAKNNNVASINNICTNLNEAAKIIETSNKYKNVFCSIGHHPEEVEKIQIELEDILGYIRDNKKVVAIGETGLDYHYNSENKKEQKRNFEIHIEACRKTKLPLIVHTRDADTDMMEILESEMKNGNFNFVLHCFSSTKELAYKSLGLGGFISLSGIVTFKNATELQSIVKTLPLDRIFLETDAPYLSPVPFRGKENQPANVYHIAKFLAELLNLDFSYICKKTTENAASFFKLVPSFM